MDRTITSTFLNFSLNNKDDNTCVQLCVFLCLRGSRSEVSNSLNLITNSYSLDKFNIVNLAVSCTVIVSSGLDYSLAHCILCLQFMYQD